MRPTTSSLRTFTILAVVCLLGMLSAVAHSAVIDTVRTGEVTFTAGTQDVTLTPALTNLSSSILWFTTRHDNANPQQVLVRGNLLNASTIRFVKTGTTGSVTVRWHITEFASGVSVQRGTTTQSSATTNTAISAVTLAESFVLVSTTSDDNAMSSDEFLRSRLTTTTNLETALNSGTGVSNDWQVVSMTGASVQRGILTLASGSASTTQAITAVDTTRAFVLFSFNSPTGTGANIGQKLLSGWLSSPTQLTFQRNNTAVAINIAWEVVELPSGDVVQERLHSVASGTSQTDVTIGSVNLGRAIAFSGNQSIGGLGSGRSAYSAADNAGVASWTYNLLNSTTLRLQRTNTAAAADVASFVVEFAAPTVVGDSTVARVGAWTTGLTHTASSGNNRLLVLGVGYENATDVGVSAVTYGGQSLTRIGGAVAGTTLFARSELWYLNETGIAAASGSTFSVTWGGTTPTEPKYGAATFINVDQSNPIGDFGGAFTDAATPNPLTVTIDVVEDGMSVGNYFCGNAGSYSWTNSFVEGFDQGTGSSTMSSGEHAETAAGTATVSATHSGPNRSAVFAAALNPVGSGNQAPVLASIGPRNVNEGANLNFNASASDPDLTTPTLSVGAGTLPANASFNDNGNGTGTFNFNPSFSQAGVFNVLFIASDGTLADSELVAITVANVNQAPVLATIGPRNVNENANLNFNATASDGDGTTPTLVAQLLPTNATFNDNANGTGTFNFNPDFTQSGVYNVRFIASDGSLADTEMVAITVNNVNRAPVLAAIGGQSVSEGALLTFGTSATDPDATTPALTVQNAPAGATYTDNGNGTATFNFTPTFAQSGVYSNVRFIASDGALADTELVTITVNNVNQAPVLAAIGAQSVNEGVLLTFGTSASDFDATPLTMTAENTPVGATYTDNGNGTATFNFTPTFAQSGVYNVRFIVSDGSLADTELVAITVNNVNQAPVLAVIGPKSVNEEVLLTFGTSATDFDATPLTMIAQNSPIGATYTDNGNGTASFSFTPTLSQSGVYNVRFIASDGSLADTEIVAITVNNVNQAPVLAAIGPQSVNEGVLLTFGTSATDFDATPLTLTAESTPSGATYTDNGNGTATFNFTPTFAQSGVYNVRFIVSDGALADTEMVAITVNNVNQAPVLAAIGAKNVNEGVLLSFGVSATDVDAATPTLTAENSPIGASFTDNGNGTGSFTFTPDFTQAGVYNVRFIASDGSLADTELVAITVNNVNRAPVLAAIGAQSVNEGVLLSFGTSATDPDAATPVLTAENAPAGATYTDNGNGTASFSFTPTFAQAGVYNVRFIASDGSLADTEIVAITVNNVNLAPVLATIGAQIVNEGVLLSFGTSASDPDATFPALTAENSPAGATYTDNGNGTASFSFTPNFTQAGVYNVRFIASDGSLADTELVAITVNNVNLAPVLAAIGPRNVNENANLNFNISATDADATTPTFVAENVPTNASFVDNANGTGTFDFNPDFSQAGVYNVRFITSDGSLSDTEVVAITVNNVNRTPVLAAIGAQSVNEGVPLTFGTSATDPDGTFPALTAENAPSGATYTDNGNGTASFSFTPTFAQSGVYNVRFIASDGSLADTELVAITVNNVNLAPVLAAIGPRNVDEGQNLTFGVSASDPDATNPVLTAENMPVTATFTDNGNGTGTFDFDPDFTQAGVFNVRFIASDGSLADTELVAITVNDVNRSPVLAPIGAQSVDENQNLTFGVSASDPDLTTPTLVAENVPVNASFIDNGNGTGSFDFDPDFTQSGVYNVRFIALDGSLADTEVVAITVNNVNRAPVLNAIGPRSVDEGQNLNFAVSGSDPDLNDPALVAENVPTNATFTDNGDGTGSFDFDPDFTQSGVHNVRFIATDGSLADTEVVAITVNQVNLAPVLAAIGPQSVNENANLNFNVSASDVDATTPSLTAENVPTNAAFVDNGNGTGTFDFNPDFTQSGVYNVRFIASDGSLADTEMVAITVNNVNRAPVLAAIGAQSVNEGVLLSFGTSATDPDATTPVLTAENAPVGAIYTDNGNGTASFSFTPTFTQSGVYNVRFIASDGSLTDTELVAITVNNVNQAPVLAAIGAQSVNEGVLLTFGTSASDFDATPLTMTAENTPAGATYTDNGNGTATFNFAPTFAQSGVYNVRFIVSDGSLADTELVAITVNNVNLAPVLAAIGAQSVSENANLNFNISATDPDATTPSLTAENVPTNASFVDNGNGTGTFDFDPDFTQAGLYNVRFIASDGSLADTEVVAITVNNVNRAPVLAAIGAQSVNEGVLLSFGTSASDLDGTFPALIAENSPVGATYTDNGNGTASFSFTPNFTQSGVYNVRFIASDGALADTELVAITVNNVNLAPVLASIGSRSVMEGANLNFGISATDVDATTPTLTAENVPTNATFVDNGNGTGTFDFDPDFNQAGVFNVRFIASDGALADTEVVAITVDQVNLAPVLAAIGSQSVSEGQNLTFGASATDPDASTPTLTAENVPTNASFVDNGNGTGSFDFDPDFTQSGVYNVRFIASDGSLADTEIVAITVNNVNLAPVLAAIGSQSVDEGQNLTLGVSATDPDLTSPALIAQNVPVNATFTDNGNGTGTLGFDPDYSQAGVYNVRFIASDGGLADTELVAITVNDVNRAPVLASIGPRVVSESQNLNFAISATDPEGSIPSLVAQNVPVNATFTDHGNGTGTFDFDPDLTQSGVYNVRFIASDGIYADSELVAITVNNVNQAPVLAAIGPKSVNEGVLLTFGTSASDFDATPLTMTAENSPVGAAYTDNGNGTATFNFTPTLSQSGVYNVRFIVSDGSLADTEIVAITVNNVNQAPVLAAIGPKSVNEGVLLTFGTSATDFDATPLTMVAENVPAGAAYTDNGNGTATFNFTPTFLQSGVYNVRFIVSDGSLADSEIVAITVNQVNLAPVLASIGPRSVNEGANLNFNISATDPDATTPSFVAENVPTNATFVDNGNGTGTFDFNPDFTQAGVYNVRFIASDGSLTDTELVAITVTQVNLAPVLAAIGAKSVNEGVLLSFGTSATDPDATIPVLTAENAPSGATYTDNGNGTATFNFTPTFAQSGVHNVRFIASDGSLADTEIVAITVNNVNLAPVLSAIGPRSVNEGTLLTFGTSASDFDATPLTMSAENTPAGASYTDNGNGTATFNFTPTFAQSGVYNVRFIASDGSLADSEIVAITVTQVNLAPVLATIGPRSVTEGQVLNFGVSASDADATTPTLAAENVPTNASFIDNGNGSGSFSFSPNFIQAGIYNVRFIASDGALSDTEIVAITVNEAGNQSPVLAPIGTKTVTEGNLLSFRISGSDPEFAALTLFTSILPTGAVFVDSGNGAGSLVWTPTFAQAGTYFVTFAVQDPPGAVDNELVRIDVIEAGNQRPVLAAIGPRNVQEGANLNFIATATDADATTPTLSAVNLPANATFVNNGNGTGTFNFNAAFGQAGVYNVTFIATDGSLADSEIVAITVGNVNEAPILAAIGPRSVNEGVNLNFGVSATDPDLTIPTLVAQNVPVNALFTDNGNGTGTFDFNPDFTQAGVFNVRFIASDGSLADTEVVAITVTNVNRAPVLAAIGPKTVNEGVLLSFATSATDPDATNPVMTAENTPAGATYTDNGNGTASFSFTPTFLQAGVYNLRFIASDGALADTEVVVLTVNNVNLAPVLAAIGPKTVDEGVLLTFGTSANDPDGTFPAMTAENTPAGATYTDNGNGTASFSFTPNFTQSGIYNIRFIASDGSLADTEIVALTVTEFNRPPVLTAIGAQSVNEGVLLTFGVSATDPDASIPALIAQNTPAGASFTDNGNGTGSFSFTPTFAQSGVYNVRFIATDGALADTEIVAITVNNVNLAPVLASIGARNVNEGASLNFNVSGTDPDATTPALSAVGVPVNASFIDNGNGTGTFDFDPDFTQSGVYNVTFIASDGSLADSEIVAITVNNINRAPVLAAVGAQSVAEGANLNFGVSANDPDLTTPALTAVGVPANGSFIDNGNGTGTFNFDPDFTQAGVYNVTFVASDGVLADSEVVAITVTGTNLAPVLTAIGAQSVTEGQVLNFNVSATDPDGFIPSLVAQDVPANGSFIDNGNGTGTFNFAPNFVQSGVYNVRFIASDGLLSDTELVAITVNEAGNQPPVLAAIGPRNVTEGLILNFNVSATDPDATTPSFVAQNVPTNASFVDNGNGTGTFNFAPDFTQAGVYNIRFIASDGSLADTELVAITVNESGNQRPVLAAIGPKVVTEGQNLNFGVSATDPDATVPALQVANAPANSNFTDNGNGTGTFDFNPDFTQAGVHNVTFIATDGALADTEIVAITVNSAGNQRPVLAAIGPKSVNENQLLSFGIAATDPDASVPVLFAQLLPAGALFDDNSDGTGSFDWTPTFAQSGVYNVRFIATDGLLADTEIVAITVNNVNRAPVLTAIGAKSVNEGVLLTFGTSAADPDATPLTLTAENTPLGATYTDNGNGTATFNFTPTLTQSGVYNVRFIVSDGSLADSELVAITVNNSNQAPVLAAIGAKSVDEGVLLTFGTSATDFDATPLTMTAENTPAGAIYTDNGNGTATFNFTPTFAQSGVYNVRFITSDGSLADTEIVAITVNNVNQAPVLAAIGPRSGTEGILLTFGTSASDIDATPLTMTAQSLPSGATYTDHGNGTATFTFTPTFVQAGIYNVRFIVSDGILADSEMVAITINESGNQAPVLATIGPRSVTEGAVLNFNISASDPDATTPSFVAENVPTNASFVDNGNSTGSFSFSPNFVQAGVYNVRFITTDGSLSDTEVVAITVNEAGNQRPVLATIGPRAVTEGQNINFGISANDADSTIPTLIAQNTPANSSFIDNGNGTGTFDFNPDFTQAGIYNVRFIATDGSLSDTEIVVVTVNSAGNQRPVLAAIGPRSVDENQNLNFDASATDADATTPTLIAQLLPSGATFSNNGDGTGTFDWTPSFTQSGVYNVRFIATDGSLADTEIVAITVNNVNRAPVLASIGPRSVNEGQVLNVAVSAADPDLNIPTLAAQNVPTNGSFVDNGNGTGSFTFSPDFTQSGVYNVLFITSDGTLADSELVAITVNHVSLAPVLAPIGAQSVDEGQTLNVNLSASDFDATIPTLVAQLVPANANFTDNGNGTGLFTFTPDFTQGGAVYNVRFIASDGALADTEVVAITVNNVNRAPVLATIGPRSVNENANLNFGVSGSDPDGTTPTLIAQLLPTNASFIDNGIGTGTFNFNPDFTQSGVYNVRFIASDGSLADTEMVAITVNDINAPPVLAAIGPKSVDEADNLNFNISATDIDATIPTLTAIGVPANASFVNNGNGTGTFDFTPDFTQSGIYNVTFIASDGLLADSEVVQITVTENNRQPVANAGTDQGPVAIGFVVTLDGSGSSDLDGDSLGFHWRQVAGPAIIVNDSTSEQSNFTPTVAGTYRFRLIVDDAQIASLPDTVQVTAVSRPSRSTDLMATVAGNSIQLNWSAITTDTSGSSTSLSRYVVYRGTRAYFTPTVAESIGVAAPAAVSFTDNNLSGADVVGDTGTNYFYCLQAVDAGGGRSEFSNRVGEYDYQIYTTSTTDFSFVMMPFANTGITTASDLIQSIGVANVNTVNRFIPASQSYEARFAAGFGPNFAVVPGGIYQVNAKTPLVWSVAGRVPDSGTISYPIVLTSTTDFSFIGIPFERELDYAVAQNVIDAIPGVLNTLNRFIPTSQSYESRFYAGFGPNFPVRAGRVYQANARAIGAFPAP